MENHLIIGLGGTGGSILREMRKRIYEEFRDKTPQQVNIEYLYVDSSPADLNNSSNWKTMGGSVHLLEAQKVSIHGVSAAVLNNLPQYPGVKSFVSKEDRELLDDISSLISDGIGGQRRRLGRLLFANNLSGPQDKSFITRLKQSVQNLIDKSQKNVVTFHICAGLAGGTGSGSVIDAIAQIRKEFSPQVGIGDTYKINLYCYVPEIIIANPSWNCTENLYQPNGYAALSELNAISVGVYKPHDVTGLSKNPDGTVKRLLQNCDAFESAYLFSNINEANRQLKLGTELSAAVADFLFQKIVAGNMIEGGQMEKLKKCENEGRLPERDGADNPVHGRRFLSFGIKRIEYPETEVKEYVTYNFAKQAARQLQFNKWIDGTGFAECISEEVGLGFKSDIQDKKTKEGLLLSDSHLTLSTPIVDRADTKKWKEIEQGWESSTQFFADDVQREKDKKKSWFRMFTELCENQYNTGYRGQGVVEFYKLQRSEKKGYAAHIRRHIENKLFEEWHSGVKSILEVEKFVNLLIADCDERIPKFDDKIAICKEDAQNELLKINNCNKDWSNIGWIKDTFGNAPVKVLSAYKTAKCNLYIAQTRIEGYLFAKELLQSIKEELLQLLNHVTIFHSLLTEMLKHVEEQTEAKCKPQTVGKLDEDRIVKKYDPNLVRDITRRFVSDETEQKNNASQIRNKLVSQLNDASKHNFGSLIEKFDLTAMEDLFIEECFDNAARMMEDLATADATQRMIGVNILEKIKQEYNTDERLENFIRNIVQSAQCYLQFNPDEIAKVLPGGNTQMMRMVQLSLPEYNDQSNFRQKFINTFQQICPGFTPTSDLSVNYKSNQIVVVAAASGFPLRFVANVANLKEKYDEKLIGQNAALNKMVLHTETHPKPLPELFAKSIEQKETELIPIILLAYGMNLVIDKTNPTTGKIFKAIGFPDDFGDLGDWLDLGKTVFEAVEKLAANDRDMEKTTKLVEDKLQTDYIHNAMKKELQQSIADVVKTLVLPLCGNNDLDPRYVQYKAEAVKIFKTKLAEQ
ncbi:MAG: tubulin-like doman-containing protein [Dysgonamonadaceae bacterium]|jgi:hypothetical protein|nr:tubulin-like doman-containing protein [Dysgonamonadaceae bacterium]